MSTFVLSVGSLLKVGSWDCKSLASTEGKEASLARGGKVFCFVITLVTI